MHDFLLSGTKKAGWKIVEAKKWEEVQADRFAISKIIK